MPTSSISGPKLMNRTPPVSLRDVQVTPLSSRVQIFPATLRGLRELTHQDAGMLHDAYVGGQGPNTKRQRINRLATAIGLRGDAL
jgi:hypothetical protein